MAVEFPAAGSDFKVRERLRSNVVEVVNLSLLVLFFFLVEFSFAVVILNHNATAAAGVSCCVLTTTTLLLLYYASVAVLGRPAIYVVDYVCYKPPSCLRVPFSWFQEHLPVAGIFDGNSIAFMTKLLSLSGLSEETYLPPALHYMPLRPADNHREAMEEARMVLFPIFEQLLSGNGLSPGDVDILVVNCSGFCPDPSLASMVVSRFGMREDVRCFNLTGMGCSANTVAVDIVRNMMVASSSRPRRRTYNAVILSTEILSTEEVS
ncbi:unnamed protein product [Cuscuta campestris]|uniref:FAE domain-containing protein n=1 Tax=Cuscuta campestris TaxID=132261 RepID=A0A484KN77_9ASTE|nr:unnamed protein product [Cuscuta campestris]